MTIEKQLEIARGKVSKLLALAASAERLNSVDECRNAAHRAGGIAHKYRISTDELYVIVLKLPQLPSKPGATWDHAVDGWYDADEQSKADLGGES